MVCTRKLDFFYDINKLLNHNNLNIKKKVYKILVYLSIYAVD